MLNNVPAFFDMIYTNKDGNLTSNALLFNDETNRALMALIDQINKLLITTYDPSTQQYTNKGLIVPQATTVQITAYGADATIANGAMWFNTDLSKLQVKTAAATIETITSV